MKNSIHKISKSKIFLIILVIIIAIPCVHTVVILLGDSNRYVEKNNIDVLETKENTYYDIMDLVGKRTEITENDVNRMHNLEIEYNEKHSYEYAYYDDVIAIPVQNVISRSTLHKAKFFGSTVYFDIGSYIGSNALPRFEFDVSVPDLIPENITKINIFCSFDSDKNCSFNNKDSISDFLTNYTEYLKKFNKEYENYDFEIYYTQSDPDVYEWMDKEQFLTNIKLTEQSAVDVIHAAKSILEAETKHKSSEFSVIYVNYNEKEKSYIVDIDDNTAGRAVSVHLSEKDLSLIRVEFEE